MDQVLAFFSIRLRHSSCTALRSARTTRHASRSHRVRGRPPHSRASASSSITRSAHSCTTGTGQSARPSPRHSESSCWIPSRPGSSAKASSPSTEIGGMPSRDTETRRESKRQCRAVSLSLRLRQVRQSSVLIPSSSRALSISAPTRMASLRLFPRHRSRDLPHRPWPRCQGKPAEEPASNSRQRYRLR